MSRKDRKRYSREFKLEAVRRANESGKPVAEVARELDISVHHLYRWRDEAAKQGEKVFPGKGKTNPQDELTRFRRENALKMAKDQKNKIAVFKGKQIRRIIHQNERWFPIVDVIEVLTGSERPRKYWNDLEKKLSDEGYAEVSENIGQLKMEAPGGKMILPILLVIL